MTHDNNLLESSTILTDKVELIELPKDSILPTGFRFIDLFILPDVFSWLACPNYSTTNTLKLQDIEDKKKGLAKQSLCKLNVETVNLSIAFILHLRLTMGNDNPSRGMKTMEITIRVSEVSGLVIHHLLSCAIS